MAKSNEAGAKKAQSINLFDIREIEVETKTGRKKATKVQFAKDVQILYKGNVISFGEYNSAFMKSKDEMMSSLEYLVENEYMTAEEAEEKAKFYDEKGITAQLTVKI